MIEKREIFQDQKDSIKSECMTFTCASFNTWSPKPGLVILHNSGVAQVILGTSGHTGPHSIIFLGPDSIVGGEL